MAAQPPLTTLAKQARHWVAAVLGLIGCGLAWSQDVSLAGVTSDRALLVIDGRPPRFLSVGQSHNGVKLVGVQDDRATVEVQGQRRTLAMGQSPLPAGDPGNGPGKQRIVLTAGPGGHYMTEGKVNGRSVQFLLDTGATAVALSESEAKRIGLHYENGRPIRMGTANGETTGRVIQINSLRIGEVTSYNVTAVVTPTEMPFALLGNTFLARFNLLRENDRMILQPRY
ncbi:MAG TPA: retropepsin-like aspartic protease [Macromonas sp.]|nr:retropepsin-like aspartic protease [Macromonas sp.]